MHTSSIITQDKFNSQGASWGDLDNDGDLDLFVTNGLHEVQPNSLFLNQGKGDFIKVTTGNIVLDGGLSFGSAFDDYDNDGNLDLIVANFNENNFLYRGNGNGTFEKMIQSPVMNESIEGYLEQVPSMAAAWSDYNRDGFSDLFIANQNGISNFLYQNSGNRNHWIRLKLQGVYSNRSAIGAKVILISGDKLQYREVNAQSGYSGQNDLTVHFGLGKTTEIDEIRIIWPSGVVQVMKNLEADQYLEITEEGEVMGMDQPLNLAVSPNPCLDYLTIRTRDKLYQVQLFDLQGNLRMAKYSGETQTNIDTSSLSNGIYLLKIQTGHHVVLKKIFKY